MSILTGERVYTVKDSPDLIARCLAGDETAVADLYRLFAADVYRLVYGLLGHREDAEEVMQDTFVYAIRNLSRFNPERASFRTWLFVIATSRAGHAVGVGPRPRTGVGRLYHGVGEGPGATTTTFTVGSG